MSLQIIRSDITNIKADAIVNTANPEPLVGGGTDRAVYQAAGENIILAERKKIGDIAPGKAAVTSAGLLKAKYIIHTVGPSWIDGKHDERKILTSCYDESLTLADRFHCSSIAFPLIATGVYGFPKDEALEIAVSRISSFLLSHEMEVLMVVFDRKAFALSGKLFSGIKEYIDENYVEEQTEKEYRGRDYSRFTGEYGQGISGIPDKGLTASLADEEEGFQECLFRLIDRSGMDDVAVYKKANVDRKLFSAIKKNKNYHPKKKTVLAFAVALQLDVSQTEDLLLRAGYALSSSSKTDLIVKYFIRNKTYDIMKINEALFKYSEGSIGSDSLI